jgi:putative ABC transport system permease protein
MGGWWQDVRFGLRLIRARPGFSAAAIVTIGLGIGANTAIFSAMSALLLRPLPIADVDRLLFGMALREGYDPFGTSLLEYALYRDEARTIASSGLGAPRLFHLVGRGEPERLRGAAVTASYLGTLAVEPPIGRLFSTDEDRPGGPAVVLLGHGLWQRRFGGDPQIVGRALALDGRPHTVIGVLPAGFDMPFAAEVWVPMQTAIESLPLDQRAANANELVARMRPGVTLEQVDAELARLAARLAAEHPQLRRGWSYRVVPLRRQLMGDLDGSTRRSLFALSVGVGALLLLCCANVAGLLLARGVARRGELATRLSLGARRGRLVRQLVVESLLLAIAGGLVGLVVAVAAQPLLTALQPIQAAALGGHLGDFRIDWRVLGFAAVVTLLGGVLAGLLPALQVARAGNLAEVLERREQRSASGVAGKRALASLVVGEVAIAATLLVGAALMVKSLARLQEMRLGFRPDGVLTAELPLSEDRYPDLAAKVLLVEQVLARVRTLPGVTAAGVTSNVPLQRGVTLDAIFEVEGAPPPAPDQVPITAHRLVTAGYAETLGLTLRAGRFLDERDRAASQPVAVVSETLARQSWPAGDALGKRVRRLRAGVGGPWMTVVGVVADSKEDRFGFRVDRPVWYLPLAQHSFPLPAGLPLNLAVRSETPAETLAAAVRREVLAVDATQPVASVMPMREYLGDLLVAPRFGAVLMGALAVLGLVIAVVGLYALLAYAVSRRVGEIGVRMALGARPVDALGLVLRDGTMLLAAGLALGSAGAWALGRMLRSTLYGVSAADPATFAAVGVLLLAVGLLACGLPARRAARIQPLAALKSE